MLIEFSVKNFRSFKEKATLSLVAGNDLGNLDGNILSLGYSKLKILSSVVLYGANASGKSNFLKAFDRMATIVNDSAKQQRGDKLSVTPHLFDVASTSEPSEFEVIFVTNETKYQYGFSVTNEQVMEEWLFAYPNGRAQRWFSRIFDADKKKYSYSFSDKFSGQRQLWMDSTRENSLFLSTAVQLNNSQLSPIFDWFKNEIAFIGFQDGYPQFTASLCKGGTTLKNVVKFLKAADSDIKNIEVISSKFDLSKLPPGVPDELKEKISNQDFWDVKTVHSVIGGEDIQLDLEDESDGTQKLFGLIGPWLDILASGKTVFVDELNDNLHPLLVRFLVKVFHDHRLNKSGAQLIFSSHDTNLLNQKILRRDQVWFVQKKKDNSSKLFPLSDFSPRKDRENIGENYLLGRYGALPYLADVASAMGVTGGN